MIPHMLSINGLTFHKAICYISMFNIYKLFSSDLPHIFIIILIGSVLGVKNNQFTSSLIQDIKYSPPFYVAYNLMPIVTDQESYFLNFNLASVIRDGL